MSRMFARAVTDHVQLDSETFRNDSRVDDKRLLPLARVFRAFFQSDFGCKLDDISHLKKYYHFHHNIIPKGG